jgi:hypothetical protein
VTAPRHPGARPTEFEFPFALARVALARMEAVLDDLAACAHRHEDAGAEVCATTEGQSARAFEARLTAMLARLAEDRIRLAEDIETLRSQIARATRLQEARAQAIDTWQRRMTEYREHQRRERHPAE